MPSLLIIVFLLEAAVRLINAVGAAIINDWVCFCCKQALLSSTC